MSIHILDEVLDDTLDLMSLSRKGIHYKLFNAIVTTSAFSMHDWSLFLHLSENILEEYEKEQKAFSPIYAERILEVARVQKRGKEIFSNSEHFKEWMNTESIALGSVNPKELLDNSFGIQMLHDELTRIEHGVLA